MTGLSQLSLTTRRRLLGASGTDLSDTELIRLVDSDVFLTPASL